MCLGSAGAMGILLFLLTVAASPFVIVAAVVHVVRNHRAEKPLRILD